MNDRKVEKKCRKILPMNINRKIFIPFSVKPPFSVPRPFILSVVQWAFFIKFKECAELVWLLSLLWPHIVSYDHNSIFMRKMSAKWGAGGIYESIFSNAQKHVFFLSEWDIQKSEFPLNSSTKSERCVYILLRAVINCFSVQRTKLSAHKKKETNAQ